MEFYFTTCLTEAEHSFVRDDIREFCNNNDMELVYYRSFKNGHVPLHREVKVRGDKGKIAQMLRELYLEPDNVNKKVPNGDRQWTLFRRCEHDWGPEYGETSHDGATAYFKECKKCRKKEVTDFVPA